MNNMKIYYQLLLLIFLFAFSITEGVKAQPIFEHISSDDGLSENVVNCIFQDSRGYMWFGTNDGLSKYDGYHFTIYKPKVNEEGGINSNLIFALTEDLEGNIWIGTTGAGISKFNPYTEQFTNYQHNSNNPQSISSNQINDFFTDSKGRIWISTTSVVDVIDPLADSLIFHHYNFGTVGTTILEDKKGNIWAGSPRGLYRSFNAESLEAFDFQEQRQSVNQKMIPVNAIAIDKKGRFIIDNYGKILYQNKDNELSFTEIGKVDPVRELIVDDQDKIWVGSYSGLYCYANEEAGVLPELTHHFTTDYLNPNSLSNNLVTAIFEDRSGLIWVGLNGKGLNKFDPNRKAFKHYKGLSTDNRTSEKIRSIFEDSYGTLWIGTEGDGVFWKTAFDNTEGGEFNSFRTPARAFALCEIQLAGKKYLWVGAEGTPALSSIEISDGKISEPQVLDTKLSSVFTILQDRSGNIWIGSYNSGLHRWKPLDTPGEFEKTTFLHDPNNSTSLSNNIIRRIIQDSRGNLWIGTGSGLNKISFDELDDKEINFERYKHNDQDEKSLTHDYVLEVMETTTGEIWVGTFGGGVNKLIPATSKSEAYFEHFSEEDGLANNVIKSILEDELGNLWIASNRGLSKLNPKNKEVFNFSLSDGLQANEFSEESAFLRKNGEMIFGGTNGYNVFHPSEVKINAKPLEVFFTDLYLLNKRVRPKESYDGNIILEEVLSNTNKMTLNHKQKNFSIEFSALDYLEPQKIKYAYMLEGYDKLWKTTNAQNRVATYTNLPKGDYTLKVKAANADGVWSEKISSLSIRINPPFWLTGYAYALYTILIIGLLWFFRQYELIGIQEKHELRMAQLEREKKEEVHNMKLQFFTNISHELRTPLTLIISPLENLIKQGANLSQRKINEQYHLMYKNSKYLLRLLNQLLDLRKLDQGKLNLEARYGDFVKFVNEAVEPFQFMANKQEVDLKVISEAEKIYFWFDQDVVEKILYNLLSNAFKYTPAGGKIHVRLKEVENLARSKSKKNPLTHYMALEVIDTGRGISPKAKKRIFERFYKEGGEKFTVDGAGIGLSFTQSLVKRHYGQIDVESKKDEGSTFTVRLPMSKSTFAKAEISNEKISTRPFTTDPLEYFSPEQPSTLPEIDAVATEEKTVDLPLLLFVDDNPDIRRFIKSGFENDFRIIEAENGVKGLEIARSTIPDIIICDIMMPEMDGVEMCNLVKKDPNTSHIPVVLLTAKITTEDEIEGLEQGADAYIRKPFELGVLKLQIQNIYKYRENLKSRFRREIILEPSEITVTSIDEEFLKRAVELIEEHMEDAEYNVESLVKDMYISRSKLYLKLKALTGLSSSEFIRSIRLKRAVQLFEKSGYSIKEVMIKTGFNTPSYFSKCFKHQFGVLPSEYVKSQKEKNSIL